MAIFLLAIFLWHLEKDTWALEGLGILVFGFMVVPVSTGMRAIHTYAVEDTRNGQGMVGNYRDDGVEELTKGARNDQVDVELKTH